MPETLVLRLHDFVVGRLRQGSDKSRVRLDVDTDFDAGQITLTESFTAVPGIEPPSDEVSNFLGGYVPEGHHRLVMASRRGIDAGDLFALLREFGGSLAGALTVRSPDIPDAAATPGWLEHLSDAGLGDLLRQALRDTDQAVPDDSRSTLPGFQPKVLAHRVNGGWAQPHGSEHSTFILKPQVPQRASRLVDEYYGHLMAQEAGLSKFSSELLTADGVTFLAIQRFDREVLPDGAVRLIHQEDAAQALALDWRTADAKFEDPNWPGNPSRASAQRVANLLASGPGGSTLVHGWVRRLVFSILLGDNDAHA
ncbi:MAG: type II toxin-antitoxin system HipA family toxin, partial [Candidatus Nanopelagicales bacterium]